MDADLTADLYLYPTESGGKKWPVKDGYRCPCFAQKDTEPGGWDCLVLMGEPALNPGERRRVGFAFVSGLKAADIMRAAGKFYLWEGRFIGEAVAVTSHSPP
jgi:hypothetical protein